MSQTEQAEGSLVQLAQGDRSAFLAFARRHESLVNGIAGRFAANAHDREDLVQEIFLDLWRNASRFDPALGSETAFIATIARRRVIDQLRRRGRRVPFRSGAEEVETLPDQDERSSGGIARIDGLDEVDRVRKAMQELRPDERRVIELAVLDGASQSQIAEQLSTPLGTVKSLARRGMLKLRELVARSEESTSLTPGDRAKLNAEGSDHESE